MTRHRPSAPDPLAEARAFVSTHASRTGVKCAVCVLPREDVEIVAALRADRASHAVIAKWLREKRGHTIAEHQVGNHCRNTSGRHVT